ncbi:MAG: hypothetical protein QOH90_758 [Actinomycetota bacterium]|jgi:hypothetical protein|nr:hypothetical protein [Actinomycetota bacterium]
MSVVASMLLLSAPAKAATSSYSFSSSAIKFTHNGKSFKLSLGASHGGEGNYLTMTISKTKGSGSTLGTAQETWGKTVSNFTVTDNLSDGKLHPTDAQMNPFGKVNLDWGSTGALQKSCNDHNQSRKGVFHGTFKFKTGIDKFGTILLSNVPGTFSSSDGQCPFVPDDACPDEGRGATHFGDVPLFANEQDGAATASFISYKGATGANGWSRQHFVFQAVPADHFDVSDDAQTASAQGAGWYSGSTTYTASAESNDNPPTDCGTGKQWFSRSSSGDWTSGLKVTFLVGGQVPIGGGQQEFGSASRTIVQNKP